MPVIKSARKRVRQEAKRRKRNKEFKANLKQLTKQVQSAIDDKKPKKLDELLPKLQSVMDRAVKKNLVPANTAKRRMSRLTQLAKDAGAKPYDSAKKKSTTKKKSSAKKSSTKKS